MNFDSFGLAASIMAGIKQAGYTNPTPVQEKTIPITMQGKDVMGLAQTGTGKTAAFVLPMLHRLLSEGTPQKGKKGPVRALIIAPTRELAEQINETIWELGKQTPIRSMAIYGGASSFLQMKKIRQGVDVVVACPGRLLDHVRQKNIDLSRIEMLVLDEADRMLDMGFMPDIKRILEFLPKERQTLLFSATMPDDIRNFTRQIMRQPEVMQLSLKVPLKTISHALYPIAEHLKTPFLIDVLKSIESKSVLVFTRTKARARRVTDNLQKLGFKAAPLQGNMTQGRRQESLGGFKSGKYSILVATDIAARGVDVSSISHVINYDIPDTADAYTHRVGRTGRAERNGEAFTFVTPSDRTTIKSFERTMGMSLPTRQLAGFNYAVAAPARPATVKRNGAIVHTPAADTTAGYTKRYGQGPSSDGRPSRYAKPGAANKPGGNHPSSGYGKNKPASRGRTDRRAS